MTTTSTLVAAVGAVEPQDVGGNVEPLVRRAPRIKPDDVFREADALLLAGHRPTIDRVRVKLGRGSPNTINEFLDAWWSKLGSRLRDMPNQQQFPALPERVAVTLQQLWNEALDGAHATLRQADAAREETLTQREVALRACEQDLQAQERALTGRHAALEEALAFTREQLVEANRRAGALEESLRARDTDLQKAMGRVEQLERSQEESIARHDAERERLTERYAKSEARWLTEVDRVRQELKAVEKRASESHSKLNALTAELARLKTAMVQMVGERDTAIAVRVQLEERFRLLPGAADSPPAKSRKAMKRTHVAKSRR